MLCNLFLPGRVNTTVPWVVAYFNALWWNNNFTLLYRNATSYGIRVDLFLKLCKEINFLVALDKTFWGEQVVIFLGMLIDTINQTVSIPVAKRDKTVTIIHEMLANKKTTVIAIQQLAGLLNFISTAVIPGRAFTRRLYNKCDKPKQGKKLKPHHHIKVDAEMRSDLNLWLKFLQKDASLCWPFMDFSVTLVADEIEFFLQMQLNQIN